MRRLAFDTSRPPVVTRSAVVKILERAFCIRERSGHWATHESDTLEVGDDLRAKSAFGTEPGLSDDVAGVRSRVCDSSRNQLEGPRLRQLGHVDVPGGMAQGGITEGDAMLTDELRSIPVFKNLTDSQRKRVAERLQEVEVDLGTVLARQGDFAYHLFVVREGTAVVTIDGELVTSLGPGSTFGEIGVLDHGVGQRT